MSTPRREQGSSGDLEKGQAVEPELKQHSDHGHAHVFGIPAVLVSGIFYAISSGCLTILNKHALSGFHFEAPFALLCFQCALTVVLVKACEFLGFVKPLQPLRWELIRVWWVFGAGGRTVVRARAHTARSQLGRRLEQAQRNP